MFQVIGACVACSSIASRAALVQNQLIGMNTRNQSARTPGGEDPPRLRQCEGSAVAKYVAELGKSGGCNRRDPALHQQIHIGVGAAAKFGRNDVRSQKRPGDIQGLLLMQLLKDVQDFQLALPVQAVAALGFKRGGPVRGELA